MECDDGDDNNDDVCDCSYSGADIAVVCREALLRPIRRLGSATHFKRVDSLRSLIPVN